MGRLINIFKIKRYLHYIWTPHPFIRNYNNFHNNVAHKHFEMNNKFSTWLKVLLQAGECSMNLTFYQRWLAPISIRSCVEAIFDGIQGGTEKILAWLTSEKNQYSLLNSDLFTILATILLIVAKIWRLFLCSKDFPCKSILASSLYTILAYEMWKLKFQVFMCKSSST